MYFFCNPCFLLLIITSLVFSGKVYAVSRNSYDRNVAERFRPEFYLTTAIDKIFLTASYYEVIMTC